MITTLRRAPRGRTLTLTATLVLVALAACSAPIAGDSAPVEPPSAVQTVARAASEVNEALATLRRVTAPFHQFRAAVAAGWSNPITSCMVDPSAGGMGYHYGNAGLIDGSVQVDQPELLLYEPQKNGELRLVAVEYIIPYTFHARSAEPPVLFGQRFKQNDTFQLWGLHAWVWKENPGGVFASWNPRVTCEHAPASERMVHGGK